MNTVDALSPDSLRPPERINSLSLRASWARGRSATSAPASWNENGRAATWPAAGSGKSTSARGRAGRAEACKAATLITLPGGSPLGSIVLTGTAIRHHRKIRNSSTGYRARHYKRIRRRSLPERSLVLYCRCGIIHRLWILILTISVQAYLLKTSLASALPSASISCAWRRSVSPLSFATWRRSRTISRPARSGRSSRCRICRRIWSGGFRICVRRRCGGRV